MVVDRGLVRMRDTKLCGKLGGKRKLHTLMLKILEACTYLAKLDLRSFGAFLGIAHGRENFFRGK
jgi:hypothetical protein